MSLPRPPGTLLAALALCLVAIGGGREAVAGQSTAELLNQHRLHYTEAKRAYEYAVSSLRVVQQQFDVALNEVARAKRSGDDNALDRAYAAAHDRSVPLRDQEERVAATRTRLSAARDSLIDVVTVRLEELLDEMDAASSSQQRTSLNAVWMDLNQELRELESEREEEEGEGQAFRLDQVVMPEITFDPRDTPEERILKAEILERRAARTDSAIQDVDRQIKSLNDRIRMERQRRDLLAGLNRFDDTRLPVVGAQPTGDRDRPVPADTTAVDAAPVSLEDKVKRLSEVRERLIEYRDQHLLRARVFRESIRQVTS